MHLLNSIPLSRPYALYLSDCKSFLVYGHKTQTLHIHNPDIPSTLFSRHHGIQGAFCRRKSRRCILQNRRIVLRVQLFRRTTRNDAAFSQRVPFQRQNCCSTQSLPFRVFRLPQAGYPTSYTPLSTSTTSGLPSGPMKRPHLWQFIGVRFNAIPLLLQTL